MKPRDFILKAIEGGYLKGKNPRLYDFYGSMRQPNLIVGKAPSEQWLYMRDLLLDPTAWQAVGKVEGWPTFEEYGDGHFGSNGSALAGYSWFVKMHRLIDALADGKTIEEHLATL